MQTITPAKPKAPVIALAKIMISIIGLTTIDKILHNYDGLTAAKSNLLYKTFFYS